MKNGSKHTEETRKKMREAFRKAWSNPELRKRASESHKGQHSSPKTEFKKGLVPWIKGKHFSEESKMKMSLAHKGKPSARKGKKTGKHSWNWGKHPTAETLKRQSEATKKVWLNPELRKRQIEAHKGQTPWIKGKHHTEESKRKMSIGRRGKLAWNKGKKLGKNPKHSEFMKGTKYHLGFKHSEEARRKMSEASKKHWENPEFRKRQTETHIGKPSGAKGKLKSEEARRKMSETKRRLFSEGKIIPWAKGKHPSEESIRKMGESQKKRFLDIEVRKRQSESLKKAYSNPELRKRQSEIHTKSVAMHAPEFKKIMRENILKRYESGKFPRQENTKPEREIKREFLKRGYVEGEDFIHQYKFMNKFMCDFCFPKQKVIVEVYGDFWHCNPKIYPVPIHPHQIKDIGRDKSKEAYITKVDNHSWTYLVLWESDIKKDVSKCVDRIGAALKR